MIITNIRGHRFETRLYRELEHSKTEPSDFLGRKGYQSIDEIANCCDRENQ
jgi:hypothetical protein